MTSLWLADRVETSPAAPTLDDVPGFNDVVVVGAGITGLMTAVLLARAGRQVLVLEARTAGCCATGNTTGKISMLQADHLSRILAMHGKEIAGAYVEGNRAGQQWLLDHCAETGVAAQLEDAYTYAQSDQGIEPEACRSVGLPATWADDAEPGARLPTAGGHATRRWSPKVRVLSGYRVDGSSAVGASVAGGWQASPADERSGLCQRRRNQGTIDRIVHRIVTIVTNDQKHDLTGAQRARRIQQMIDAGMSVISGLDRFTGLVVVHRGHPRAIRAG